MKILHGADFHLDSAFRGLPEDKARERRQEGRALLRRFARLASDRKVDLVLLSGDLFDGEQVYRETAEELGRALGEIPCPVFIAPGNHDPYGPRSPYRELAWPENVHIFTDETVSSVRLPGCTVYGAAFTALAREGSPLAGFSAREDGGLHIMCLHGDLRPGPYAPITQEEIAASGLDYLALGHVHQCSGLCRAGGTAYAYPGCPEGRGFDELGDKGVLLVTAEPGRVEAEFVPLCSRRYEIVTAALTPEDPQGAVAAVLEPLREGDIVRLRLTGEVDTLDVTAWTAAYDGKFYSLEWEDHTGPAEDIWRRVGEDSLRGIFLKSLREQYDAAVDDAQREKILMAVRFGLAALDNRDLS